jgi:hypothetical protein
LPVRKFAAYRNGASAVFPIVLKPIVKPLYTAPLADSSTTITAQRGVSYPPEQQDPILPMQPTGFMRQVFQRMRLN